MEKKIKQRICADPQNLSWKEDNSSIGHRLLAKMGWKVGDGLGKTVTGSVNNIKVAVKGDTLGLGAKEEPRATWSNNAFETLLQGLNNEKESKENRKKQRERKIVKRAKRTVNVEKKTHNKATNESAKHRESSSSDKVEELQEKEEAKKKVRFYRQKFVRNKNVSQYSAKHLSEILGIK